MTQAGDRLQKLQTSYMSDLGISKEEVSKAFQRISYRNDLAAAAAEADLVIEAIPEVVRIETDLAV